MDTTDLWQAYAAGDERARERLLADNLGLVHHVARQLARGLSTAASVDELVSAGTLGLVAALESFDPARGHAFSTYAAPRIRGAILDELRRLDHAPRLVRRKARDIAAARDALTRELERAPTPAEVAARLGVDVETLWRWESDVDATVAVPLDRPLPGEEDAPRPIERLADEQSTDVEERLTREQETALVAEAIAALPQQERTVLALYYHEELKLAEIAAVLGVTESRVSQIRSKALGKLRSRLAHLRKDPARPACLRSA